jgi:hypothetical protein
MKKQTVILLIIFLCALALWASSIRRDEPRLMPEPPATYVSSDKATPAQNGRLPQAEPDVRQQELPPPPPPPPPPPFPGTPPITLSPPEPTRTLDEMTIEFVKETQRYLPKGAHIYTYPVGKTDLGAAIMSADLRGDGEDETVVVYSERKPTPQEGSLPLFLSVLVRKEKTLAVVASVPLSGGVFFNPHIPGLGSPFAVRDVTGDNRPEIIVVSGGGASIGGALQVFKLEKSSLRKLADIFGHFFSVQSAGVGKARVIKARSRYEKQWRTYEWDGVKFQEAAKTDMK